MKFVPGTLPTNMKFFLDLVVPLLTIGGLYFLEDHRIDILFGFTIIQAWNLWMTTKGNSQLSYRTYIDKEVVRQTSFGSLIAMNEQWLQFKAHCPKCPKCDEKHLRGIFLQEVDDYGVVGIHAIGNTLVKCSNPKCNWAINGNQLNRIIKQKKEMIN